MFFREKEKHMLITRFNKMIRNKTLWWFFAITVSVTFVWAYSDMSESGGGCSDRMPNAAGKMFGQEISQRELESAMTFAVRMRNYHNQPQSRIRMIRREGWKRIAALKTAEKLGISATIDEMTASISRDPTFQVNGAFNKDRYTTVIQSQMQVPVETFEEFLRQEIILQKLGSMLESCVWTSPSELNQRLTRITDIFTLKYAVMKQDKNTPVSVSEDDAGKYFEKNIEQFRIPDRINVKFVSFPLSNYFASADVSEKDVSQYYTNNIEKYTVSGTNGHSVTPFEKVKDEIASSMKKEKAVDAARNDAARLVTALIPNRTGKAPTFEEAATRNGLSISTSAFFSLKEQVPGMKVDGDFNRAAFDLDASDPERYFSDSVTGEDAVYVLAVSDKQKTHLPEFSQVKDKALSAAKSEADRDAFAKKCETVRNSAAKSVKSGKTFEDAFKDSGATISSNITFSAYEAASSPFENFDIILPKIMSMAKGEITEPIESDDGLIIAYVADRKSGTPTSAEMLRPEMIGAIDRSLTGAVYEDWKEYTLAKSGFVDSSAPAPDESESSEEPSAQESKQTAK